MAITEGADSWVFRFEQVRDTSEQLWVALLSPSGQGGALTSAYISSPFATNPIHQRARPLSYSFVFFSTLLVQNLHTVPSGFLLLVGLFGLWPCSASGWARLVCVFPWRGCGGCSLRLRLGAVLLVLGRVLLGFGLC